MHVRAEGYSVHVRVNAWLIITPIGVPYMRGACVCVYARARARVYACMCVCVHVCMLVGGRALP